MVSDQNCMTRGSITTSLHPLWNHPNTGPGQFKYFIDVDVWNSFLGGGKVRVLETKVAKFAMQYSLSFISCNLIGYFKQALKSDWLFCF